ncbi:MAG TPA: response regulator transcription factor [Candidatus Angelobacter sp.]|nr:response regulator transcription factor [Candidatus Angelobacter sp.]
MTSNAKKLRLVVADDHELVRRGIRDLLQTECGWKVVGEAADGHEAVEKVKKLRPDIAILDITMPNVDGLEATRQIRQAAPRTQVLIVTMHESDEMVRLVLEAGAGGYVLKSDLGMQLVQAVKDVAHGKISLTPRVSAIVLEGFLKVGTKLNRRGHSQAHPTPRETEIIRLLAAGKANKEIAAELGITVRTVETHRARIMLKMGFHSLTDLIRFAIRDRIVMTSEF